MRIDNAERVRLLHWLYAGELLTGCGTTLLGCILPALISTWHMSDARAGMLFAAQFAGSSFGALLVSHDYFKSLTRGFCLMIAGALAIAVFANANHAFLIFIFLVFGLGLGLTMTAISMLASSVFSERRGSVLSLLNAYWGLGAVACPMLATLWIRRGRPETLFVGLAIASSVVLVASRRRSRASLFARTMPASAGTAPLPLRPILSFAVVAFLYVGVEASVSGWMMSYVHRLTVSQYFLPPIAASCFWIALICGRALAPALLRRISEANLLAGSMLAAFVGLLLLLLNRSPLGVVLSVAPAGLALGPIFPLCLAKVLALANDSPSTKWVFATAGLGGALMPWLTGNLSTRGGSLRTGLTIPLFALGTMLVLSVWQMVLERGESEDGGVRGHATVTPAAEVATAQSSQP